jgi:hypothetical protein
MMKKTEKKYIGTYKVVQIFKVSGRRKILERGLTIEQAQRFTERYESSSSMVVFYKQFTADKYFK